MTPMRPETPTRARCLQTGVTALELAIVTAIGATLVAAAAPDFSGFVANAQLRSASENLRSGLRLAQIEAIKRQAPVELVLTDDEPGSASVRPASDGRNWVIRAPSPGGGFELLQSLAGAAQTPRVRVEADRGVFAFDPLDAFARTRTAMRPRAATCASTWSTGMPAADRCGSSCARPDRA
ncbi:MAG: GspH/FimT family pseudopilin [Burkholderiaceae bacterium]